jgi:alkane 1-monooxygenase
MRDLKFLLAYLVPLSAIHALDYQGVWSWLTVFTAFVILPIAELFAPQYRDNFSETEEKERLGRSFFDWLLYLNAPLLYGITGWYIWLMTTQHTGLTWWEIAGMTFSTGIVVGTTGINVAHELGHRTTKFEQWLSKAMLLPALYQHFFVEHNRGHHKNVATDADPASARFGEVVYAFWWRSITGSWRSAWQIEADRLRRAGLPLWSWHNQMLRFCVIQSTYLGLIGLWGGAVAVLAAIAVAIVGILLLETVNYIEHYGLRRRILPSGHPEPVTPAHSWNSDHEIGRIFLYELTRHSDHHYKSTRKYQILRHLDESPQLPYGYPACMLLSLVPPVWFRVMNKRLLSREGK